MTTAANIKNVRNMSGPGYFRRIGDALHGAVGGGVVGVVAEGLAEQFDRGLRLAFADLRLGQSDQALDGLFAENGRLVIGLRAGLARRGRGTGIVPRACPAGARAAAGSTRPFVA